MVTGGVFDTRPPEPEEAAVGAAEFSVIATPGQATFGGLIPACSLTGPNDELFVVLYHIDNNTCDPISCEDPFKPNGLAHLYFRR